MPVVLRENFIDFTEASEDEKADYIFDLLLKQKESTRSMLYQGNFLSQVQEARLIFLIATCSRALAESMGILSENRNYMYSEFFDYYTAKLIEHF